MKIDLEPAKDVLRAFYSQIAEVEKIRKGISAPICAPFDIHDRTPNFSYIEFIPAPESFWEEDNAHIWIYADVWNYSQLMHCPKSNAIPTYYLQLAQPIYEDWLNEEKEVIYRGIIILPPENANLYDYLISLSLCIQEENEKRAVWIKSLKSFLQYIRDDFPFEWSMSTPRWAYVS